PPLGRPPSDFLCGALHVEAGGERVSTEPQQIAGRKRRNPLAVSAQTRKRDRGVLGCQPPEALFFGREGLRVPEELQPAELAAPECDRQCERNVESKPAPGGTNGIAVREGRSPRALQVGGGGGRGRRSREA